MNPVLQYLSVAPRISTVLGASLVLVGLSGTQANAACAVSIGNGEGPTKAIAERLAKRDARVKAGASRPQTASFSEPVCYVADDFKRGIATYGCEVQYSYCTAPAVTPVVKPVEPGWKKHRKAHKHWRKHHHGHGNAKGHLKGHIAFGSWKRSRTEIACLRFNAKASASSADKAGRMANGALIKSVAANIGHRFSHHNLEASPPTCLPNGTHRVTCTQTARYCF